MTIENRDESAEKGFGMVFNSYNSSKNINKALNEGKILYYFIASDFGGFPIEQGIVDRHPEEYMGYLNSSPSASPWGSI